MSTVCVSYLEERDRLSILMTFDPGDLFSLDDRMTNYEKQMKILEKKITAKFHDQDSRHQNNSADDFAKLKQNN